MRRQEGFSLIEVLVSLLLICIGLLGMAVAQGRAVQYTHDATLRGSAVMLANELLELMRSNRGALLGANDRLAASSAYYKADGDDLPTVADGFDCAGRDRSGGGASVAKVDLGCWRRAVERLLPVDDELLRSEFIICRSKDGDSLCSAGAGSSVTIQVAWRDAKSRMCDADVCTYTLRTEL
ncbi:type IV pilus modification protein PilV [Pseudomonas schmalbachii]|uniref:Type IV pilus modification protein PilV n=1 Tax=Pseudomonas schmalbachii TaxID=2816993 RepID=A0ABS3TNS2_9PSED|nr:type IV pilus modification protein PilV [Pseudomonas schmalbachii]MBO3275297.1 type IV pilus modification protein PilV [Pseudomonas schmalbachii]